VFKTLKYEAKVVCLLQCVEKLLVILQYAFHCIVATTFYIFRRQPSSQNAISHHCGAKQNWDTARYFYRIALCSMDDAQTGTDIISCVRWHCR